MLTDAIVIKCRSLNEHDRIVTLYSKDLGKTEAIAKSVLKNESIQKMHLDIFNLIQLELVAGRVMPIITGAQAQNTFPGLKNNLHLLSAAYFFTEVVDKIFYENQRDNHVWNFLTDFLNDANNKSVNFDMESSVAFIKEKQAELLYVLGYMPDLKACSVCATPISGSWGAFDGQTGGAVCPNCFLSGYKAVFVRDLRSGQTLTEVFQSIAGVQFHSLSLLREVFKKSDF